MINQSLMVTLNAVNNTTAAFNGLNKNLNDLKALALRVGATLVSALAIRDVIDTTNEWSLAVSRVQAATGLQAVQASRLAFSAKAVGLDSNELVVALDRLAKQMFSNSALADKGKDAFDKWGIKLHDAGGATRNINDLLIDAADKVKAFGNGAAATALEMDLFGRSGGRLHELLMLGAKGVEELQKESDALGFTVTNQGAASLKEFRLESIKMGLAFDGLKIQMGIVFLPILRQIVEFMTSLVTKLIGSQAAGQGLAGIVKVLGQVFGNILAHLKGAVEWFGNIWTKLKELLGPVGAATVAADLLTIALAGAVGGPILRMIVAVKEAWDEVWKTIDVVRDHWEEWRKAVHDGSLANQGDINDIGRTFIRGLVLWGDDFNNFGTMVNDWWQRIRTVALDAWITIETHFLNFVHDVKESALAKLLTDLWQKVSDIANSIGDWISNLIMVGGLLLGIVNTWRGLQGQPPITFPGGGGSVPPPSGAPGPGPVGPGSHPGATAEEQRQAAQCNLYPGFEWNWGTHSCEIIGGTAGGSTPGTHALGGIFTRPTLGIIGEAGPEAVIPLDRAGGMGNVIIQSGAIVIHGDVDSEQRANDLADAVGDRIVQRVFQNRGLAY